MSNLTIKEAILGIARTFGLEKQLKHFVHVVKNRKMRSRIGILEEKVKFLYYEVSDLRSVQRHLIGENTSLLPDVANTYDSFDYQWSNLKVGEHLLSDEIFKASIRETILEFTGLDKDWFQNKEVLDAGCGNGRFSYGLASLGASVTSVDQSLGGITEARSAINSDPNLKDRVQFHQKNLLKPLDLDKKFDLVWSFGVLHHTGNTYVAFKNVIETLKPGGYLFLMLYGEPEWNRVDQFNELNQYWEWRRKLRHLSSAEKVKLLEQNFSSNPEAIHGWFDAVSPAINDCYTETEILTWLRYNGFSNFRRTVENRNIFLISQFKPEAQKEELQDARI